ncbi:sulfurtransferase [Thioflexithrix psekupsensis]|uniref:Sulfurtransferase n=1 Tax=Thioflexithrix psekupsensis TaxID=1570016 RepID=A0A251X8L2_9GAMM|nr:sulfurtransferase [Thioflexithrix psekupsensis]OUD13872.1 sulfurtransferase [Thioflexithrix psekupsensis]
MIYNTIISSEILADHLSDPNWVIIDCRFSLTDAKEGERLYRTAHIPFAHYLDLNQDLSAPKTATTGRHPLPDAQTLAHKLGQLGIDRHTQVIAYDADGGFFAARLWWLLRWLGHPAVALLDGGLPAWQAAGYALTDEVVAREGRVFAAQPDAHQWVDMAAIEALDFKQYCLLDARSAERFRGQQETLDPIAGHIPGAQSVPCGGNLDAQQKFLSPDLLRQRFTEILDGHDASQVICMCGSGVTACHNLLAMEIAGLGGARLYVGSWSEWITIPTHAVATE